MTEQPRIPPVGITQPGFPVGFTPLRELGAGGWGTVVLARQVALDRLVAIKVIIGGGRAGQDAVARFRREARTLAALNHPAVVRIYDLVSDEDDLYLVMEYVEGRTMRDLLDHACPSYGDRLAILTDVATALTAAAEKGLVHRDVKPANVLVRADGRAKLADFGLARLLGDAGAFRTALGTVTGSPAYMSPEQATGSDDVGRHSDAYSFAVLAYEALVGVLPYETSDVATMLRHHREGSPRRPTVLRAGFPKAAERVLLAALTVGPARRPLPAEVAAVLADVPLRAWPSPPPAPSRPAPSYPEPDHTEGQAVGVPPTSLRPSSGAARELLPSAEQATRCARVDPPVFDPGAPAAPRRLRRAAGLLLLVAVAVIAVVATRGGDPVALRVTSLSVTVSPGHAACPSAAFDFTAVIGTNGRPGQLELAWRRPDGTTAPGQSVRVRDGLSAVSARLHYTVSGSKPFTGSATALLPAVGRRASAQITYSCP